MNGWLPPLFVNMLRDTWAWAQLHPFFFWPFVVALAINNGLRVAYKDFSTRPRWARCLISGSDPFCLNFWRLATWTSEKFSLPFKFPSGSDDAIPTTVIQKIVADQEKHDAGER